MRDGVLAARQLVNDGFSCALSKALASFSDSHEERSFQKKLLFNSVFNFCVFRNNRMLQPH